MDPVWGPWSEWIWDGTNGRWWRARQDIHGNVEYDFETPREVEHLTGAFNNLGVSGDDTTYAQTEAYTFGASASSSSAVAVGAYGASVAPQAQSASSAKDKGKAKSKEKPHKKHRNKTQSSKSSGGDYLEYPVGYGADEAEPFYQRPAPYANALSPSGDAPEAQGHLETTYEPSSESAAVESTSAEPEGTGEEEWYRVAGSDPAASEYPPPQDLAEEQSVSDFEPSETGFDADHAPNEQPEEVSPYFTGQASTSYHTRHDSSSASASQHYSALRSNDAAENDDGRQTPTQYSHQSYPLHLGPQPSTRNMERYIGGNGPRIILPDEYVVEPSYKFRPGEVFKVLWCEPHGTGGGKTENDMFTHKTIHHGGKLFYQGIRRFIVVRNYEGHCACVPILTYERQACKKRGVKPAMHGIIHQHNKRPEMLPGEPALGFPPVKVRMYEPTERLCRESRVNYSKLYSVEHNLCVYFIGSVDPSDFMNIVQPAADSCYLQQPLNR